jgi:hypothetical protein
MRRADRTAATTTTWILVFTGSCIGSLRVAVMTSFPALRRDRELGFFLPCMRCPDINKLILEFVGVPVLHPVLLLPGRLTDFIWWKPGHEWSQPVRDRVGRTGHVTIKCSKYKGKMSMICWAAADTVHFVPWIFELQMKDVESDTDKIVEVMTTLKDWMKDYNMVFA